MLIATVTDHVTEDSEKHGEALHQLLEQQLDFFQQLSQRVDEQTASVHREQQRLFDGLTERVADVFTQTGLELTPSSIEPLVSKMSP